MVENCISGYNSCMFAYGQVSYAGGFVFKVFSYRVISFGGE